MLAQINAVIQKRPRVETGYTATFFRINDTYGFKMFGYEDGGDEDKKFVQDIRKLQRVAHSLGFAPAVGRMFKVEWYGCPIWGYVTECVVETWFGRHCTFGREDWNCPEYDAALDNYENDEDVSELRSRMMDNNYCTSDLHWHNVGYMPDGRLVCIDFS